MKKTLRFIGAIWGRATTVLLSIGVAILPVLQTIDPFFLYEHPRLNASIIGFSIAIAILRVLAPPPARVDIDECDEVQLSDDRRVVTLIKAAPAKGVKAQSGGTV